MMAIYVQVIYKVVDQYQWLKNDCGGFLFVLMLFRANKAWKHGLRIEVFSHSIAVS